MDSVTSFLLDGLDSDLRGQITRRWEAMLREVRYLQSVATPEITLVFSRGWNLQRLEVICGLNSFYQVVVGPLASSARDREVLPNIAILHGQTRFDDEYADQLRRMGNAFLRAVNELPNALSLLTAVQAQDLVYRLASFLRTNDNV